MPDPQPGEAAPAQSIPTDNAPNDRSKTPARSARRLWPLLLLFLLLVALLAAGAGVWLRLWQPLHVQLAAQAAAQTELAQRLDALGTWQTAASDDLAALEGRSRGLAARLDQLGPERLTDWSLAEADYLLRSAQRAARNDYDPTRAALALTLASASLVPVPASGALRASIDSARLTLDRVTVPDLDTLADELAHASSALRAASLREPGMPAAQAPTPGWRGTVQQAWQQLSDVIVLQRVGTPVQPLLRPQEGQYLRQQLALKLSAADYALRRRDSAALHGELADLQTWAEAYLDSRVPAVAGALETLRRLASTELQPALPDLSGLTEQLAALRHATVTDRTP